MDLFAFLYVWRHFSAHIITFCYSRYVFVMENQLDNAFPGRFANNTSSKIRNFAFSCNAIDIIAWQVAFYACLLLGPPDVFSGGWCQISLDVSDFFNISATTPLEGLILGAPCFGA
jgi:hypothetical protein